MQAYCCAVKKRISNEVIGEGKQKRQIKQDLRYNNLRIAGLGSWGNFKNTIIPRKPALQIISANYRSVLQKAMSDQ